MVLDSHLRHVLDFPTLTALEDMLMLNEVSIYHFLMVGFPLRKPGSPRRPSNVSGETNTSLFCQLVGQSKTRAFFALVSFATLPISLEEKFKNHCLLFSFSSKVRTDIAFRTVWCYTLSNQNLLPLQFISKTVVHFFSSILLSRSFRGMLVRLLPSLAKESYYSQLMAL